MTGFEGADVQELLQLATKLEHAAGGIAAARSVVSGRVSSAQWIGPDADRFRAQWSGELQGKLKSVSAALEEAGKTVRHNADQQIGASTDDLALGGVANVVATVEQSLGEGVDDISRALLGVNVIGGLDAGNTGIDELIPSATGGSGNPLDTFPGLENIHVGSLQVWPLLSHGIDHLVPQARLGSAIDGLTSLDKISNGTYSPFDAASDVGSIVQSMPGIGWLGGLAIKSVSYAAENAAQTDWSAKTAQNNLSYVVSHPMETVDIVGQSAVKVLSTAVGWL